MSLRLVSLALALVVAAVRWGGAGQAPASNSVRFAVIGDNGTGARPQYEVADQMVRARARFPFDFVLMLGDNIYGGKSAQDFRLKFEEPYRALLAGGVRFYASLGNHDNPNERLYRLFNMDGKRFYTFTRSSVRFFALDSTYMSREQLGWLERELSSADERWKICFFHHPMYSSGARHGSDIELRQVLEPLFVRHHVNVVFAGHDHIYERINPQQGIYYFISGAAGQLRSENVRPTGLTAKAFMRDRHFMLVEVEADQLRFEAVSRTGEVVDSGILPRHPKGIE